MIKFWKGKKVCKTFITDSILLLTVFSYLSAVLTLIVRRMSVFVCSVANVAGSEAVVK